MPSDLPTSTQSRPAPAPDAYVHLRAGGVSVLLDLTGGRLPAVAHWGSDLGDLTLSLAAEIVRAGVPVASNNEMDDPVRLAVLPEAWTGWTGRPGISGSREGTAFTPKFTTTAVRLDADPTAAGPGVHTPAGGRVEVTATDPVAELDLHVWLELAPSGLLRVRAGLTNRGADAYQVDDVVLALPVPTVAEEILDFAGRWAKERVAQRRPLGVGTHLREGRKGRTGPDAATVLHLGVPGFGFDRGEVWSVHTAWSGNHTHYAERIFSGPQVIGGGELLLPGEVRLAEGETYTTPWVYAAYGDGLDAVAHRFHAFLRARPHHPDWRRPVTINVWEAVYFHHDLAQLVDLAERAAALGVERYVLDDGWFGARRDDHAGLGDWTVSRDVWPEGLHPLVDTVVGLGMQFGLWFEPEMINEDSDLARAHPEWIMAPTGRLPVESRHQQVVNLGIPECYAHIRDAIFAVLDAYAISYIKWDHNRDLVDAGTRTTGRAGVHAQTAAVYRMMAEIRAAYPHVEIESCSSGGARVDLGVLEHTQRVWVSDCIDPLERQQMHRWTQQLLPPELLGAHIASGRSHTTGRMHTLGFRAATAIFGHLGIEWDLAQATEEELAELGAWIAFYKEHRELLLTGTVVRRDLSDEAWLLHGVVARDRSEAIFAVVSVARSAVSSPMRIRLPGLRDDAQYRVEPVLIGPSRHSLRTPAWWGLEVVETGDYSHTHPAVLRQVTDELGCVLTGRTLAAAGLMTPSIDPEQVVLYRAVEVSA